MIHRTATAWQTPEWQRVLKDGFTQVDELIEYLDLDRQLLPAARSAASEFSLKVPREFAALIEKGNLDDPILRQILPLSDELLPQQGFSRDPVGDLATEVVSGVLHKYHGRVLLVATGACGINCRYCFRRHYPYSDSFAGRDQWRQALEYLQDNSEVKEVILSGGDPLILPDHQLATLIHSLGKVPHLQRLRIHSRLPVIVPQRLTPELTNQLAGSHLHSTLVLHINHTAEISNQLVRGLSPLRANGVTLLNQSVLLRGVNDNSELLISLSEKLFEAGVLPYYLHLLDRVEGAAHFEVQESHAIKLHEILRRRLPGYLVPKLVRESAGEKSKSPVCDF
ncbi:MAG: EF-P beta-lysylation protein EpmB [Candidatus Sedimenticola sp. (ex Thyasira tokunagai)]